MSLGRLDVTTMRSGSQSDRSVEPKLHGLRAISASDVHEHGRADGRLNHAMIAAWCCRQDDAAQLSLREQPYDTGSETLVLSNLVIRSLPLT